MGYHAIWAQHVKPRKRSRWIGVIEIALIIAALSTLVLTAHLVRTAYAPGGGQVTVGTDYTGYVNVSTDTGIAYARGEWF